MHMVEGGTIADKKGAGESGLTSILDLVLMSLELGACIFLCSISGGFF